MRFTRVLHRVLRRERCLHSTLGRRSMRRRRVLPNAAWLELRQRDVSRHESGVRLAGWRAMRNGIRLRAGAGSWWRARIEVAITLAAATVISACHGAATPSATLAMRDLPIALAARYCDDPCLASTPAPRDFCLAVSASDDMAKQPLYQRIRLVELGRARRVGAANHIRRPLLRRSPPAPGPSARKPTTPASLTPPDRHVKRSLVPEFA